MMCFLAERIVGTDVKWYKNTGIKFEKAVLPYKGVAKFLELLGR